MNDTADKLLLLLKRRGATTGRDAALSLGITASGVQQQFARLAKSGLVEAEDRKAGRGRPHRFWRLTDKGHTRFPDRHRDLTIELVEATREVFGDAGLDALVRRREQATLDAYRGRLETLESLEARVDALCVLRTREGYMAEWRRGDAGEFLVVENHCPISDAARACEGFCRSELDVFRAVLAPLADVDRVEHVLDGARRCAYRVIPRRTGSRGASHERRQSPP